MLKAGDKAPTFSLDSDSGKRVSLSDYRDRTLVLYFYPRDSTPGCTRQAQGFTAANAAIEMAGASVVGVSRDSVKSHCTFRDKFGLGIPLLSDPDLEVHKAYGAWGTKVMYGKKVEGVLRTTFIVKDGRIARVFPNVKVDGHAEAVLQAIGELEHGPASRTMGMVTPKPTPKPKAKTAPGPAPKTAKAKKKAAAPEKKPARANKKTAAPKKKPGAKKKK